MDTLLKRWQKRRSLCRHASMILTSLDKLANTKGKELTTHEDLNTLYLLLTYRCNLKCVICDTWKLQVVTEKELALSEIKNLFNSSEYLRNIKFLVLGGAEPMLRKDFAPIVTFFIKNYTHISLGTTSNGYDTRLVTSRLQEISKACSIENFYIGFSLDGIGNLHDKIRGTGGAFESLVNTVTQLRNAYPDVKLWLTFTITPINYMQIMDAFEFSKKYKMEFSAQFLIPEQGKLKLRFNGKQLDKIDEMITKIIEDKYRMDPTAFSSLYHFSKLVPYQKSKKRVIKNCGAGSLYTFINPYGEIVFCPKQENYLQNHTHQKFIIGNIKDASFDKIWLSPKAFEMRKKILFLCPFIPCEGVHGGGEAMFGFIKWLSNEYDITVLTFIEKEDGLKYIEPLEKFCKRVETVITSGLFSFDWQVRSCIKQQCSPEMEEKLAKLLQEEKFDLVQVECGWMGQYNIPSQIQKVIRKHDINFIREYARFRTQKNIRKKGILFLYFLSTWYYERKVLRKFDKIIAVSDKDRDKLRRIFHHPNVDFCDPGIDTKSYMPMDLKEEENSLIFVGHIAHFPNEDAMLYFSGEILPLIKKEIHDVKLYIVGSYPTPEILNLRDRNIIVTGQVPDIRPYLAKCQLFIVPVRAGAGIRMKILHAWAMGKPVISTRVGTSGLDARDGENIVLADSPKEFAQKVIYLLRNKSIRRQLGQKGRETVEKKYDWQFAGQKMKNIYEEMLREINT